jgi:hypothetical protein
MVLKALNLNISTIVALAYNVSQVYLVADFEIQKFKLR